MRFRLPLYINGEEDKRYFSHIPGKLSEWLNENDIQSWTPGSNTIICSGTGTGKSYFVRNNLLDFYREQHKQVLYLVPRALLKEQLQKEIGDSDTIALATYQSLEAAIKFGKPITKDWDIIICDEVHYFISDSSFSKQTDLSFDWIVGQENAVKIFLTATPDRIEAHLEANKIPFTEYFVPIANSNITSLNYFSQESQFEILANQIIKDNKKGIFFLWSAQKAYELHCKYQQNSLFLCSKSNSTYAKCMDEDAIAAMIATEHFGCNLLFATPALDVGVTFKDSELNIIVIDMLDPDAVIQSIGRKRPLDISDTVNVYVRNYGNNRIAGAKRKLLELVKKTDQFTDEGAENYNAAHDRSNDSLGVVVDVPIEIDGKTYFEKQLVPTKVGYAKQTIVVYDEIMTHEDGYRGYIAERLQLDKYSVVEEVRHKESLAGYLDSIVNRPLLTKQEKDAFIQRMDIRQNRKLSRSFESIEGWLKGSRWPYRLIKFRTSRMENNKQKFYTAWEVVIYQE